MNSNISLPRGLAVVLGCVLIAFSGAGALRMAQAGVDQNDLFELGDGGDPAIPGIGDILGTAGQPGPDWDELFNADRTLKDDVDEFGNPGGNGVPDFLDGQDKLRGRRDASFIVDDVSAGSSLDASAFVAPGVIGTATVAAGYDLSNAYGYVAFSRTKDLILYAGMERLSAGDGRVAFEFNRRLIDANAAGGIAPQRTVGDLQVTAHFAAGFLNQLVVEAWQLVDAAQGLHDWVATESLPINPESSAEQCNAARQLCVFCNGVTIDGGAWPNHDDTGTTVTMLGPNTFMEFGINLTATIGLHNWGNFYATRYTSMQVSTFDTAVPPAAQDYALGHFIRAATVSRPAN